MRQYIVDAFTDRVFRGNQAAVCVLEDWPEQSLMESITLENNFSETAFTVKEGEKYHLRWFTPGGEIDLCGHATLATAYTLFRFYEPGAERIAFTTLGGELFVERSGERLTMEFPAYDLRRVDVTAEMEAALGAEIKDAYIARDLLCVLEDADTVRSLRPDMDALRALDGVMVHVTARGEETDCVSRSFGPKIAIPEDPVCGSGHCHIIPYWADTLGKDTLVAYQASRRGGTLYCRREGDKIFLSGTAALYSVSDLQV